MSLSKADPKPPRKRRTNREIDQDFEKAQFEVLMARAAVLAEKVLATATPAQKRRATIIINRALRTGEGIRPKPKSRRSGR